LSSINKMRTAIDTSAESTGILFQHGQPG
jgi:hypothetical protein